MDIQAKREARALDPSVTIVVPAMNEARNLEVVLPQLPTGCEILLVDGNSVDDTVETARRVLPSIRVLQQSRRGKGNALATGFEAATGDIIVMFDADGSANPEEIPAFVEALKSGADFAKGSRYMPEGGSEDITPIRSLGNSALNMLANVLFGTKYSDLCYGYNAFWRDILDDLSLPKSELQHVGSSEMLWGDGFEIETLLTCRVAAAELSVTEVPSVECTRLHGVSNLSAFDDGMRVLRTILAERRQLGQREANVGSKSSVRGSVIAPETKRASALASALGLLR